MKKEVVSIYVDNKANVLTSSGQPLRKTRVQT